MQTRCLVKAAGLDSKIILHNYILYSGDMQTRCLVKAAGDMQTRCLVKAAGDMQTRCLVKAAGLHNYILYSGELFYVRFFPSVPKDGSDIHRFFQKEVGLNHVHRWKSVNIRVIPK